MNLLARRHALMAMANISPAESWDSVWDFSEGLPTVELWTRSTTGGTHSMTANGLQLRKNSYVKDVSISKGTIEATVLIENERATMAELRAWLRIGNASNAVCIVFKTYNSQHHIRLFDVAENNLQNGTDLGTFTMGGEYTIRLNINGSVGSVEINGTVVKDNINTASITNKGTLMFGSDSSYGGSIWKSVKYRVDDEWERLFAHMFDGDYMNIYSVGDILPLDLGTEGVVNAQIVAFNTDDKADESGKAKITFISEHLLNTSAKFRTANAGGWDTSDIRNRCRTVIKPLFPSDIRNRIVDVVKLTNMQKTDGTYVTNAETTDDVWIPSSKEICTNGGETQYNYNGVFKKTYGLTDTARVKSKPNASAASWLTRSTYSSNPSRLLFVQTNGSSSYANVATSSYPFPIGFCID